MKSRKFITAILLMAAIGIWGYVGYSFFSGTSGEETILETNTYINPNKISGDIFAEKELKLNYADPFLRKKEVQHTVTQFKKPVTVQKVEKNEVPAYAWPEITYMGLILNQSNNSKKLGIVIVNGKESIIREGEVIADVRIVAFDKSKVEIKHEKESRVFLK
jgi:hypothetical protein